MTHETKAGLVVSGSFLCLLGVVLYTKVRGPGPEGAAASGETVVADSGTQLTLPAQPTPTGAEAPPTPVTSRPEVVNEPFALQRAPERQITPVVAIGGVPAAIEPTQPATPPPTPPTSVAPAPSPAPTPAFEPVVQAVPAAPPMESTATPMPVMGPTVPPGMSTVDEHKIMPSAPTVAAPEAPAAPPIGGTASVSPTAPPVDPVLGQLRTATGAKEPETARAPTPATPAPVSAPTPVVPAPALVESAPAAPSPPVVNLGRPMPPLGAVAPNVVPPESEAAFQGTARPPQPLRALPPPDQVAQVTVPGFVNERMTPGSTPSIAVSPPIVAPAIAQPVASVPVVSYDEDSYQCRAGDTFRSISQQFYKSERFERALLLFNRNHPRASDEIRREPPALAGQTVYLPPDWVLTPYLSAAEPPSAVAPHAAAPVSAAPATVAPAPVAIPAVQATRSYRVRSTGERYFEIAKRTLNDGSRWWEVYMLNKSHSPQEIIPAGTVLRMPVNAVIDSADQP